MSPPNRIKEIRKAKRRTLKQVAEAMGNGVHYTTVNKLERGEMELTTTWLERLAKALGTSTAELLGSAPPRGGARLPVRNLAAGESWKDAIITEYYDVIPSGEQASYIVPSACFSNPALLQSERSFVVIDASVRSLEASAVYAFMDGDGRHRLGIYEDRPPRFEPLPGENLSTHFFGQGSTVVEGRVAYQMTFLEEKNPDIR